MSTVGSPPLPFGHLLDDEDNVGEGLLGRRVWNLRELRYAVCVPRVSVLH